MEIRSNQKEQQLRTKMVDNLEYSIKKSAPVIRRLFAERKYTSIHEQISDWGDSKLVRDFFASTSLSTPPVPSFSAYRERDTSFLFLYHYMYDQRLSAKDVYQIFSDTYSRAQAILGFEDTSLSHPDTFFIQQIIQAVPTELLSEVNDISEMDTTLILLHQFWLDMRPFLADLDFPISAETTNAVSSYDDLLDQFVEKNNHEKSLPSIPLSTVMDILRKENPVLYTFLASKQPNNTDRGYLHLFTSKQSFLDCWGNQSWRESIQELLDAVIYMQVFREEVLCFTQPTKFHSELKAKLKQRAKQRKLLYNQSKMTSSAARKAKKENLSCTKESQHKTDTDECLEAKCQGNDAQLDDTLTRSFPQRNETSRQKELRKQSILHMHPL